MKRPGPRFYLYLGGFLIVFMLLSFWQKCTAWKDRYDHTDESSARLYTRKDGSRYITFRDINNLQGMMEVPVTVENVWWGLSDASGLGYTYSRDWTYLPPYFRWFYGGK